MIGRAIRIGDQYAESYHYMSKVGEVVVVMPWVQPMWADKRYEEDTCFMIHIEERNWYIRKEDAIELAETNTHYLVLLQENEE